MHPNHAATPATSPEPQSAEWAVQWWMPRHLETLKRMKQAEVDLLWIGDSITDGFRKPEEVGTSYRLGAGYAMLSAARLLAERPELNLRFENRGVSGNSLQKMMDRWEQDTLAVAPTVLSVLIGVNNTLQRVFKKEPTPPSPEEFRRQLGELIESTRAALPQLRTVILCEPFLLPTGQITAEHVADVKHHGAAVKQAAEETQSVFVPLQARFEAAAEPTGPDYWLFDGIHPNASGQWLIAEAWWAAVSQG